MQKKIIEKPEIFKNMIGEFLGYSDWKLVTQKEINNFASATEDFQWIHVNEKKVAPVKNFFDSFNYIILKLIDLIMLSAPYGVFALLAALVVEAPSLELFKALALYAITLLLGLAAMILIYVLIVQLLTKRKISFFVRGIAPAQLLAFSTSSSAATLPVTMECVEENLGVDKEVASFVLPIGATINMDGT